LDCHGLAGFRNGFIGLFSNRNMTIEIQKVSSNTCQYTIIKQDNSLEIRQFDTKTYLLHDVCHYVVEKHLNYSNGFWGMLSKGHSFVELTGKTNPLTPELRFIEQIVGPVQSVFWGYFPPENLNQMIQHLDFEMTNELLKACLEEITDTMSVWENLAHGQSLKLNWQII
jgi:hypothetical protein